MYNKESALLAQKYLLRGLVQQPHMMSAVIKALPTEAFGGAEKTIYGVLRSLYVEKQPFSEELVLSRCTAAMPTIAQSFDFNFLYDPIISVNGNGSSHGDGYENGYDYQEAIEGHLQVMIESYATRVGMVQVKEIANNVRYTSPTALVSMFNQSAEKVAKAIAGQNVVPTPEAMARSYVDAMFRVLSGEDVVAIPTHIPDLDKLMSGGWHKGLLHVLFGLPGTGKSAMALWCALRSALRGDNVLFISYEMPEHEIMDRFTSMLTSIPFQLSELRNGDKVLSENERQAFSMSLAAGRGHACPDRFSKLAVISSDIFKNLSLHVIDKPMTIEDTVSVIMAHTTTTPTDLIFVDHMFRLMKSRVAKGTTFENIDEAFNDLANVAMITNTAMVAVSQPNRDLSPAAEPSLTHLAYAGERPSQRVPMRSSSRFTRIHSTLRRTAPTCCESTG